MDCDGTLADLAETPEQARVEPEIREIVGSLYDLSGGALAVISGRPIVQLDRMLAPLTLPVAGVHGAERRDAAGIVHRAEIAAAIEPAIERAREFVDRHPGTLCETKPGSVALHYRQRPDLAPVVAEFAAGLVRRHPELRTVLGKMVVEFLASGRTKGDALCDFMREAPFAGRTPFFIGDDFTDETGFAVVEERGGTALKIGPGETAASARFGDITAFHRWLAALRHVWVDAALAQESAHSVGTDAAVSS